MSGFYYNENNFNCLYNDISILLSDIVVESNIAEEWIDEYYKLDEYNVTKAIEMYASDILLSKLQLDDKLVNSVIEECRKNISDKELTTSYTLLNNVYMIENTEINEDNLFSILSSFKVYESLDYLQEKFNLKEKARDFKIKHDGIRKLLTITESIKRIAKKKAPGSEELNCVKEGIDKFLYEYKSFDYEGKAYRAGIMKGVLAHKADKMSCAQILAMFDELKEMINSNPDYLIKYVIDEFNYINKIILDKERKIAPINESAMNTLYIDSIAEFNNLVESIFFSDEEPILEDFIRLQFITEGLINYEDTMEASSRIITKGAEKVVRAIDKRSAKSGGMTKANSKVGQVVRDTKVAGTRVADAINKKVNDILEKQKDDRRKRVITGGFGVKLMHLLKQAIGFIIGNKVINKMVGPAKTGAVKVLGKTLIPSISLGPLISVAITIIIALGKFALDKRADERERKRVLTELETELKIVREKIEDAKGDNARKQKYELMRLEASLEKEVTRIKYGLRPE